MPKIRFIVPNAFTSLNFLLGAASICWSAGLFLSQNEALGIAYPVVMGAHFIIFSALLDKLDGFAARAFNASSEFGAQFDSLADLIAFGIAPAFMVLFAYKNISSDWYESHKLALFAGAAVYMVCAAMRLAKYNAMDNDSYPDYFSGMPSTFAGIVNALAIILLCKYKFFDYHPDILYIPLVIMLFTGILMVSPLFLAKLKKRKSLAINIFQVVNIAGAYIAGFAMILPEYLMALVLIYFIIGFGHGIVKRNSIISSQESKNASKQEEA
ncbi:MAG: CDP-alcohol phosphatidyltransferase family protein [Fibromonadaceae bacterium]|jgi:CDP-diacylglycerol--serine O-phosphatidyltransferase|nr:CDP-alcohol phosphatidyltransferase family protein [Fibromonadaceae bacterium]